MTKINRMVLHGFKSFAKRTELLFGDTYNCVLGPNGSGKSNVLDAVCFVLGKSGAKGLRAEKTSNLIYNGGKSKNPSKEGEVSIWFDNLKKEFPIESHEVKISRIVRHNGQSIYKINDKTMNRQQVLDLLSIAKINPDGYNIILQGDIIRFVEMSPLERRGIIEEVGGISVYEEKRRKAMLQIDHVDVSLKESEIIMTERGAYLKELKKERDQAQKFKSLDEKIKSNKATILSVNMEKRQKALASLETESNASRKEIAGIDEEIKKLKQDISKKRESQTKINEEVEEKGDKEQIKMQKDIENIKVEEAGYKTRTQSLAAEIDRIIQRIVQLEYGKKEHEEKLERLINQKKELEKRNESNKKEFTQIDGRIEEFKKKHNIAGAAEKEKEIDSLDKKADINQEEIQKLRIDEQNLLREKDKLELKDKTIEEKMEKVLIVKNENKKEIEKLTQMKTEFKKATVELNTRLNEDSSFSAQIQNARQKALRAEEEISRLRSKADALLERISGNEAVKSILSQKEKIKGIYGTVSELGKANSEYSQALEVAAGNRIFSIVVEDDKIAAQCIKHLKEKQLGTVRFLPLNKIKPVNPPENINAIRNQTGVKGLAQELVSYDSKFKNVFSYVFGGAVVVEDIERARKIGIGSCKMVTLDGDLTEVSGAMQGGFRKRTSSAGAFLEKEVEEEIKHKEGEYSDMQRIMSTLEKRKTENEEAIERLRNLKANLEGEIIKIEKSLHLESDDLDADKRSKKEIEILLEDIRRRLMDAQNSIGRLNQELLDAKIKKQMLRNQVNELKNPRLIAELNTFEQKRQQLKDETVHFEAEIKSISAQTETLILPEIENAQKIIKQHEKEKETFQKEKEDLEKKIKKMVSEIKDMEEKQKKFYSQFKDLFAKREKLNEEINKLETKTIRKEEEIRRLEHKLNTTSLDQARIKSEFLSLEEEFGQYKDVKIFKDKSEEDIKKEIAQFEKMAQDIGAVNLKALEIYGKAEEEYQKLVEKKKTLEHEREEVLIMMNEVEAKKKQLFLNTFDILNKNFGEIFRTLSSKGEAYLCLENEADPFLGGVTISVKLSSKKFMDIRSLSGGEKTMTALALIFAIQEHEPASFYVLDEVDAALDKRNSEHLAELVKAYSKRAQYLLISHNDGIISQADTLYGVSMDVDGVSKVVTLKI